MVKIEKLLTIAVTALLLTGCGQQNRNDSEKASTNAPARQEMAQSDKANSPVISFTMDDINGNPVAVTDVFAKHKITILDFWASWCGPCRKEMPNLVKLYDRFGKAGLGIIGISLDEEREMWQDAVRTMNMSWVQLSDLQGWDNSAAQMYGIQSIPFTIIVDNKGHILETELRGEELELFIEKRLAGSTSQN